MATSPMVGGADPAILKSLEAQTPSVARTSPATVNAVTGAETSTGGTVSRGLVPQVSGGTVTYNQATQATAGNSVTVTSSTSNDPGDVVTIYTSPKAVSVSSVNQTVNSYKVNNYAGNEYTDSDVANYLPTFTGNVGAGNVNVTGGVYTYNLSSTGLTSLTNLNVSATANLGNVANVIIRGGSNGQVLTTNGSNVLSWTTVSGGNSSYGNTDVANYLPTFTGNIGANVVSANLFVGSGANLTNIAGANVGGFVPNANVANTAFAVAAANVSGLGNIATINLDGSNSNVLYGNGVFAPASGGGNASTGNVTFNDINIIGTGNLKLQPDSANANAYLDIFLTVGPDIHIAGNGETVILGTDTFANVAVNVNGNVSIQAGDANGTHTWTFATDGNIYSQPETDLILVAADPQGDGIAIKQIVTDGNVNLSSTTLEDGQFSIYTNLDTITPNEWRFDGNTLQVTTDSFIRGFASDVVLQSMASGTGGIASLQSVSNQNDPNIFSTFDATTTSANIKVYNGGSSGGTEYAWQFDNTGNLTLPVGGTIIGNVANANLSQYLNVSDVNNNFSYHVVLSAGSGDKSLHIDADDNLQYNPDSGLLTATRVDATYFVGNLNFSNGYPAANLVGSVSNIVNGSSNVNIATANGNVTINAVGNTTMTITGTGANVTGTLTSTGKIGYASGSTVTQTTNRGNGVTINSLAGTVITVSATMVAGQVDTFTVANDRVDPNNDIVLVQIVSPNFGVYNCVAQPSATISSFLNGFYINIQNISGFTTTSDAITIRFMVIKAPNA